MQDRSTTDLNPATPLSKRERAAVLARIEALMEYWGFTVTDLHPVGIPQPVTSPPPSSIKYRHPVTSETWDGNGPHPDWLRNALLKEGFRVDELRPELQRTHPSDQNDPS